MSHVVTIRTEVRDVEALRAACVRRKLEAPVFGRHRRFSAEAEGWAVELPQWGYPAVFQTESGQVQFDNYGGRWSEQQRLDGLLQSYAVEKAKLEARKAGHCVTEQSLTDDSIKSDIYQ